MKLLEVAKVEVPEGHIKKGFDLNPAAYVSNMHKAKTYEQVQAALARGKKAIEKEVFDVWKRHPNVEIHIRDSTYDGEPMVRVTIIGEPKAVRAARKEFP